MVNIYPGFIVHHPSDMRNRRVRRPITTSYFLANKKTNAKKYESHRSTRRPNPHTLPRFLSRNPRPPHPGKQNVCGSCHRIRRSSTKNALHRLHFPPVASCSRSREAVRERLRSRWDKIYGLISSTRCFIHTNLHCTLFTVYFTSTSDRCVFHISFLATHTRPRLRLRLLLRRGRRGGRGGCHYILRHYLTTDHPIALVNSRFSYATTSF